MFYKLAEELEKSAFFANNVNDNPWYKEVSGITLAVPVTVAGAVAGGAVGGVVGTVAGAGIGGATGALAAYRLGDSKLARDERKAIFEARHELDEDKLLEFLNKRKAQREVIDNWTEQ